MKDWKTTVLGFLAGVILWVVQGMEAHTVFTLTGFLSWLTTTGLGYFAADKQSTPKQ